MDNKKVFWLVASFALIIISFEMGLIFDVPRDTRIIRTSPFSSEMDQKMLEIPKTEPLISLITAGIGVYDAGNVTYGEVIPIEMELSNGPGRVSVEISSNIYGEELQWSILRAIHYAEEYTGKAFEHDMTLRLITMSSKVDGRSATAAMSSILIAFLDGKTMKNGVYILADMNGSGHLMEISNAQARAETAAQNGAQLVIIPRQNCNDVSVENTTVLCTDSLEKTISNIME